MKVTIPLLRYVRFFPCAVFFVCTFFLCPSFLLSDHRLFPRPCRTQGFGGANCYHCFLYLTAFLQDCSSPGTSHRRGPQSYTPVHVFTCHLMACLTPMELTCGQYRHVASVRPRPFVRGSNPCLVLALPLAVYSLEGPLSNEQPTQMRSSYANPHPNGMLAIYSSRPRYYCPCEMILRDPGLDSGERDCVVAGKWHSGLCNPIVAKMHGFFLPEPVEPHRYA